MKVLFLTPWYPSEKDAMSGLFVQKHVEAVRAQGVDVRVITASEAEEVVDQWHSLKEDRWMPDIVQLNVLQKQVIIARTLLKQERIPFILVEHWSGYLPENGQFQRQSWLKKRFYRRAAKDASMILTVSAPLQQAMQACGIEGQRWGTIDNVVDEFFFEKSEVRSQKSDKKTLLHVSCFDERAKNVKGLLRAAKMLSEKRQDWCLKLVGTGVDYKEVRAYADTLDIPEGCLEWTGELTPQQVADEMHKADALVLSSRYETYGVVLAEAYAAGLPILSTPVGIAEEVADLIVPQEIAQHKAGTFAEFMESILWNTEFRSKKSDLTNRFTAEAIGRKLVSIYDSCLRRDI